MPRRKSDQLDAMVGAKVRVFRINRGISQTALAEQLGVTFQQVQKYEKGTNRIRGQPVVADRDGAGHFGCRIV